MKITDEMVEAAVNALRADEGFIAEVHSALEVSWSEYIARLVLTAAQGATVPDAATCETCDRPAAFCAHCTAERDELQAKLEDVEGLSRALANGASISRKDARVFVESALKIAGVPELEARLEKVRLIHEEVKTYLPEESCADKSEAHAESRHDEDGIGGYICLDLPTGDSFCGYCESIEWPCDTVEALGGAE